MDNLNSAKWSVIVPILGLDICIWKNYRPVNNLVYLSKLIEGVVDASLDEQMQKQDEVLNESRDIKLLKIA